MEKNELNEFKERKLEKDIARNERITEEVEKEISKIKYEKELFIQKAQLKGLKFREIRDLPEIREFDERLAFAAAPLREIKQNSKISFYSNKEEK